MTLLTPELAQTLRVNAAKARAREHAGCAFDPAPVIKLFNPLGPATWLATELDDDGDVLFGLADLGFGCPELGCFSLSEIAAIRLPFGMRIERDIAFETPHALSIWSDTARRMGSILSAETWLRRTGTRDPDPDLPPPCQG